MASNTVRVRVEADSRDFERGFDRSTAKAAGFGAAIGTMAGTVALDLGRRALGAVKQFVGESIQAFSDLEQAVGGSEAVFGDSTETIDEFAKTSAESIGLAESEFRVATTLIGGQLKRMTGDVELAAEQSIILTEVGADLAATYGGTTKEAVEALSSAFRGEADPAERFNLDLKIGRVNAKALELGLADTTASIDDTARAQAILALITEQSADAQGQFAREADTHAGKQQRLNAALEDQKAVLGESLIPLQNQWMDIQKAALPVIAELAMVVGRLTGAITEADLAAREFGTEGENLQGILDSLHKDTINPLALFSGIGLLNEIRDFVKGRSLDEVVTGFEDWLDLVERSPEDMAKYRREIVALGESGELTTEEVKALTAVIDRDLAAALTEGEQATRDFFAAQREAEGATEDTTEAIQAQSDRLRAMSDPFFGAISAAEDLEQAQRDYKKAVDESDLEGQREAIQDIAKANINLREKFQELKELGIDPASKAGRTAFREMGLSEAQIDTILAQFREIEENAPNVRVTVEVPDLESRSTAGGDLRWKRGRTNVFQHGGIVTDPTLGMIGEAGSDEAVIPLNAQGIKILGAALREAMGGIESNGSSKPPVMFNGDFVFRTEASADDISRALAWKLRTLGI